LERVQRVHQAVEIMVEIRLLEAEPLLLFRWQPAVGEKAGHRLLGAAGSEHLKVLVQAVPDKAGPGK